jgi:hypothetical protein
MAHIQITEEIQLTRKISSFKFVSWLCIMSTCFFFGIALMLTPLTFQGILYWMANTLG